MSEFRGTGTWPLNVAKGVATNETRDLQCKTLAGTPQCGITAECVKILIGSDNVIID